MTTRPWLAALFVLAALTLAPRIPAQEAAPLDLSSFPRTELTVRPAQGAAQHFHVWVADTEQRSQQGLMFVRDLPESQGMVFPLTPPRVENMWMKNTYIELDMLFVDGKGKVTRIVERAHPLSLDTISSGSPVAAVVELKGGLAAKLGFKVGDAVSWAKPGG
ncbi:MAG: DUF192 domain-containing protein [Proteobacteria bacterium]|nr:DUF192 domain-containing protein [Pseudomonadota bacterium]